MGCLGLGDALLKNPEILPVLCTEHRTGFSVHQGTTEAFWKKPPPPRDIEVLSVYHYGSAANTAGRPWNSHNVDNSAVLSNMSDTRLSVLTGVQMRGASFFKALIWLQTLNKYASHRLSARSGAPPAAHQAMAAETCCLAAWGWPCLLEAPAAAAPLKP